jgi:ABC-type sugar transport system ATPase subunit
VASIHLDGVVKTYDNGYRAVRGVDLEIAAGEFMVLVGPSGCGKSTLLRLIAGLETPTAGRVSIGGADVTDIAPAARDLAMVFQSYALYPHMTVRDNLAYGLKVRGVASAERDRRVGEVAAALGLEALLDRRPAALSGGQRQRVALGRAMARHPRAFLLDEPLSNLDPALRAQARGELRQLHQRLAATIVYVTHDQEEAMTLGGRVAVMRDGIVEQVAPPLEVYRNPANTFVARFIGAPPMNLLPAALLGVPGRPGSLAGVRPHDVRLQSGGHLRARVEAVEPRGHDCVVQLRLDDGTALVAVVAGAEAPVPDRDVGVSAPLERVLLFDASGRRLAGS